MHLKGKLSWWRSNVTSHECITAVQLIIQNDCQLSISVYRIFMSKGLCTPRTVWTGFNGISPTSSSMPENQIGLEKPNMRVSKWQKFNFYMSQDIHAYQKALWAYAPSYTPSSFIPSPVFFISASNRASVFGSSTIDSDSVGQQAVFSHWRDEHVGKNVKSL